MCMPAYPMQSMGMRAPKEARERIRSSGAGVSHGCELFDVRLGLLQEQQMILTTE